MRYENEKPLSSWEQLFLKAALDFFLVVALTAAGYYFLRLFVKGTVDIDDLVFNAVFLALAFLLLWFMILCRPHSDPIRTWCRKVWAWL